MFLVRTSSDAATSVGTSETITGSHAAFARLEPDGKLSLTLDGKNVANDQAPDLIEAMPVDGLQVGSDEAGLVGLYSSENKFNGSIDSVLIDLN